jgi:flagellar hook protein FlgE
MLRSLFSGITGLRAHQQMMDVTGNNIANVNSSGYKSQTAVFESVISQAVKSPGAPVAGGANAAARGGVNGVQIGLGVQLAGVSTNFGQGSSQLTGVSTDFAIQGTGFFTTNNGTENLFTRAGSFTLDANGRLVSPDGSIVQGYMADATGVVNPNAAPEDVSLPVATLLPAVSSTTMKMAGNLSAEAAPGTTVVSSITTYDVLGAESATTATFTKPVGSVKGDGAWNVTLTSPGGVAGAAIAVTFGPTGVLTAPVAVNGTNSIPVLNRPLVAANAATGVVAVPVGNFAVDVTGLTQYSAPSSFGITEQNGAGVGALTTFTTTSDGQLIGIYSNGQKQALAQLAIATFNNPDGLEKVGDTSYRTTVNSGVALIGAATVGGRGSIQGGTLEMSNVDLASEFTNLIVAQRGFAANSRTMTAADEMLQELMSIKR